MDYLIKMDNVKKSFGKLKVLDSLNINVKKGEFLVIFGPSGCGKTTLIKVLGGLIPYSGKVDIKDKELGIVFQESRLFPWLTVKKNAVFGLELQGKGVNEKETDSVLRKLGLCDFEDDYPSKLSGGMRQKVAFARVLLTKPDIMLLDEPFSSLDVISRRKLQSELLKMRGRMTLVLVTHNIEEALKMGDRIIVLSKRPARIKGVLSLGNKTKRKVMELLR